MANYERIKIVKVEEKENRVSNNKFMTYKTIDPKTGKLIDLRFTRAVPEKDRPTKKCYVIVKEGDSNIDRSKEWPLCWVKKIEKIVEFKSSESSEKTGFEAYELDDVDSPF